MNDEQLTTGNHGHLVTAVQESLAGVHMDTPLETIISHGRKIRARRRIPTLAGALAALAAAAVVVSALLPAGHPASMQLAAWTVAKQSNGTVKVTIRQLHDPAGLQHTLRADGIPSAVAFYHSQNPACRNYPKASERLTQKIVHPLEYGHSDVVLLLHPSALPDQAGVAIAVGPVWVHGKKHFSMVYSLIQASPRCTGS